MWFWDWGVPKWALADDNILCIDGGSALRGFVNDLNIPYRVISPKRKVHEMNPIFHIQNVNGYHSRLKSWMTRFNGVATKYLVNYLGWRRCMNTREPELPLLRGSKLPSEGIKSTLNFNRAFSITPISIITFENPYMKTYLDPI